jgi:hypothetical protein
MGAANLIASIGLIEAERGFESRNIRQGGALHADANALGDLIGDSW